MEQMWSTLDAIIYAMEIGAGWWVAGGNLSRDEMEEHLCVWGVRGH